MQAFSTNRLVAVVALIAASFSAPAAAQYSNVEEVGKTPVEAKFSSGGRIRMSLCPGDVHIHGSDDQLLRVSYDAPGSVSEVRVRMLVDSDHATLRVSGCPHDNFHLTVELPKSTSLYVRMFAGQIDVQQITGDKDVELTFGQMNVDVGQPVEYAHVDASVSSGAIDSDPFDVHKGGLFRSFETSGPGKYRMHVHIGAGQIELR